jgi:hypothetical protein
MPLSGYSGRLFFFPSVVYIATSISNPLLPCPSFHVNRVSDLHYRSDRFVLSTRNASPSTIMIPSQPVRQTTPSPPLHSTASGYPIDAKSAENVEGNNSGGSRFTHYLSYSHHTHPPTVMRCAPVTASNGLAKASSESTCHILQLQNHG